MRMLGRIEVVSGALACLLCGVLSAQQPAAPAGPAAPAADPILDVIEFRELPLVEAMRIFSQQTGLNVVPSTQASQTPVSIFLRNVTPLDALEAMTKTHGLFFRRDEETGIITVYTQEEFDRNLANFRDEQTRVFTLLYPNAYDAAQAIADIFGDRVVLSFGADDSQVFTELSERLDRFDLINSRSQGLGLFGGGAQGGGGGFGGGGFGGGGLGGGGFGGGGLAGGGIGGFGGGGFAGAQRSDLLRDSRVQRDVLERESRDPQFRPLEDLTPEQIQALVAAEQGEANERLVQQILQQQQATIYVTVIRRQNQIIVRASDPETMRQIAELIAQLDVPTPLVLLEVKILEITLDDNFHSAFDYQFSDSSTIAGGFSTPGPGGTSGDILPPASDVLSGDGRRGASIALGGTGISQGDLLFQFVSESFRFRMQLLESKNCITELATPLLLTANNEVSRLFVGEEVPLNRSFTGPQPINTGNVIGQPAFAAGATAIEFRPVGTTLLITPNINADRTVTLRILQERSQVVPNGATVLVPTNTGFTPQTIDTVRSRTVSGTIVAKDGLAVAIGGLIEEAANDNRAEVPVIGKVPVLGFFFRRQNTGRNRTELMIVVRPYIFNTPTESANLSQDMLRHLSLHPNAPDARGTLGTFAPHEVVRPNPPTTPLQTIFRFHSIDPKLY